MEAVFSAASPGRSLCGAVYRTGQPALWWKLLFALLPIAVGFAALCMGRIPIPAGEVLAALTGAAVSNLTAMTVFNLRLPRIVTAALAGAGLSCAGCAFQSLFANPLATPDTLGVASGASFGAALGLLLGFAYYTMMRNYETQGLAIITTDGATNLKSFL